MKAAILLANGFEDTEALTTRDILLRSRELGVSLITINHDLIVEASSGLKVIADLKLEEAKFEDYDFLILPGGKRGVSNLNADERVIALIREYKKAGKPVYAICAAPSILGKLGYLEGKSYTCYPGFETAKGYTGKGVSIDGDTITGKAMFFSIDFGLAILEKHLGKEVADRVKSGARGD